MKLNLWMLYLVSITVHRWRNSVYFNKNIKNNIVKNNGKEKENINYLSRYIAITCKTLITIF